MRKREAIQFRKLHKAKADMFLFNADSNISTLSQVDMGFVGIQECGEHILVIQAHLGGLLVSAVASGKVKQNLVNGVRFMNRWKSDYPIVAMKFVKARF